MPWSLSGWLVRGGMKPCCVRGSCCSVQVVTGLQSLLQHADLAGSRPAPAADTDNVDAAPEHRHKRPRTLHQDRGQPPARSLLPIYGLTPKELLASLGKTGASAACPPAPGEGHESDAMLA